MVEFTTTFWSILDSHPPSLMKLAAFIWIMLALSIGLALFLSGAYGSLNLVKVYGSYNARERIMNRLFVSRSLLIVIVILTLYVKVYYL